MSYSHTSQLDEINYNFLLTTHMVCADKCIHNKELTYLRTLEQQLRIGEQTIKEKENILSQNENLIPVEIVAKKIPLNEQSEVMWQLLQLACNDGYCHPLEREMAKQVAQLWNWQETEIDQRIESIIESLKTRKTSLTDKLIQRWTNPISSSNVKNERLTKSQILLKGKEYEEAIDKCRIIAQEDYKFAEQALNNTLSVLERLINKVQNTITKINVEIDEEAQAVTAKEVTKQLEDTRNNIILEINKDINIVRESLYSKQHALNYFTIAFMGKTKVGKSTLHATLVDKGWDAIGTGKQRTTRLNRVYEFDGIRIIDTPGIGAPGGKTDKEIAESVIEESDIICYVVTNNSIQETEFSFLGLLKEKNKPFIILLNIKNNLQNSQILEHFLNNPDQLFAMDGPSGLRGHINRIQGYAQKHYANDYFEIFPVMLLAAQLSRDPKHKKYQDKLFDASRIETFLDSIRLSIVEYGGIRRSQTLLGSTVGIINQPYIAVKQQVEVYQKWIDTLEEKNEIIRNQINRAKNNHSNFLQQQIKSLFLDVKNIVPQFAQENWNLSKHEINNKWNHKLKEIQFEKRLEEIFQKTSNKFNTDVEEVFQEAIKELEIVAKLRGGFSFTTRNTGTFLRDFLQFTKKISNIAGSIILLFNPFIGLSLKITGYVLNLITKMFKTKEQKRNEAVQNISKSLLSQLSSQEKNTIDDANKSFNQSCNNVTYNIKNYFNQLIEELGELVQNLRIAESDLLDIIDLLNRAYAKRIIDWCCESEESLTNRNIFKTINKVERDFGNRMKIYTKYNLKERKSKNIIKNVLQEDIDII
ncbi:MAG: GTPase RsgA [Dolichospermum sp. UKL201]|jgi:GTP-binding protein EngB required for normal cell division|nr:MAG: GTPase RsgA [Dolichospermum sp. UKL201]